MEHAVGAFVMGVGVGILYPSDETAPGVVIAYIPDRKQFYASVVRYEGNMGTGKKVLVSSYADTPRAAFSVMAKQWADGTVNVRAARRQIRTADDFSEDFELWGND